LRLAFRSSTNLAKLGVASRGEAAALVYRGGLVDDRADDLAAQEPSPTGRIDEPQSG
jgi:hypothetical protein